MPAVMRFVKCRLLAPILLGVVGINCDQGAIFGHDTMYVLPTAISPFVETPPDDAGPSPEAEQPQLDEMPY